MSGVSEQGYLRVLEAARKLPREEQLLIIERLAERLRSGGAVASARARWEQYAGTAPWPLCGEDAQEWVSRTRQESDGARRP